MSYPRYRPANADARLSTKFAHKLLTSIIPPLTNDLEQPVISSQKTSANAERVSREFMAILRVESLLCYALSTWFLPPAAQHSVEHIYSCGRWLERKTRRSVTVDIKVVIVLV